MGQLETLVEARVPAYVEQLRQGGPYDAVRTESRLHLRGGAEVLATVVSTIVAANVVSDAGYPEAVSTGAAYITFFGLGAVAANTAVNAVACRRARTRLFDRFDH